MASVTDIRPIEILPREPRSRVAAPTSGRAEDWSAFFESVYQEASGDAGAVPWANAAPNPALVSWLNSEAPGLIRPGATVAVVGCGLGDDVRELADRGYDVVGFDCSPTAISWARRRHTVIADRLLLADLFALPSTLARRHDLVVEINTLQAIDPSLRPPAAAGVVSLARPRGAVLVVCRAREEHDALPPEPPFPLTLGELETLMAENGLAPMGPADSFVDDECPPIRRLRAVFRRPI